MTLIDSSELRDRIGDLNCDLAKKFTQLNQNERLIRVLREKSII